MDITNELLIKLVNDIPVIALLVWMVMEERKEKRRAQIKLEECQEERANDAREASQRGAAGR